MNEKEKNVADNRFMTKPICQNHDIHRKFYFLFRIVLFQFLSYQSYYKAYR